MSFGRSGIAVAALAQQLALAPPVAAQDASTLKKEMIGQWELATTERSKTCVITMKGDATPQGLKLELEPAAPRRLLHKDIRLEYQGWISCGCRMPRPTGDRFHRSRERLS